jgi:hypothetical protein
MTETPDAEIEFIVGKTFADPFSGIICNLNILSKSNGDYKDNKTN